MKRACLVLALLSAALLAESGPRSLSLDADLATALGNVYAQIDAARLRLEVIRLTQCLRSGIKADECGPMDQRGQIRITGKTAEDGEQK